MTRKFIPQLDTQELPWTIGAERHAQLPGGWIQPGPELVHQRWFFKPLSQDDETGAATMLFRYSGGTCYPAAGYHPVFEEAFFVDGQVRAFEDSPAVPCIYKKDFYFYRPPGWIHDSEIAAEQDTLILRMTGGHDARVPTEWDRIGRNALLPIEQAVEPRGYIHGLDTSQLPWVSAYEFMTVNGWEFDLKHVPKDRWSFRLLSLDPHTGSATVVMRLEKGLRVLTAGYYTDTQEMLVLEGDLAIGGRPLTRLSYVYRPAGVVEGPIEVADTLVFCRFGARVKRIEAPLADVDKHVSL